MPPRGISSPTLIVAFAEHCPIGGAGPMNSDTLLNGEPLVSEDVAPMYESCCALLARGLTGQVTFVELAGKPHMNLDIGAGAKLTIEEEPRGPRVSEISPR